MSTSLPTVSLLNTVIILSLLSAFFLSNHTSAQTIGNAGKKKVTVITPKKEINKVDSAQIDDERFEFGVFGGSLSIEDFDTVVLVGLSASYHINSRFMASLRYGQTSEARAAFERFNEGVDFVPESEDGFRYLALEGSFKLVESRSFLGKKRKYNSRLYIDLGVESIEFIDESEIGFSLGFNYKVVVTDWLTSNLIFKDHIVNRDFLGESKLTHNLEVSLGFNALF